MATAAPAAALAVGTFGAAEFKPEHRRLLSAVETAEFPAGHPYRRIKEERRQEVLAALVAWRIKDQVDRPGLSVVSAVPAATTGLGASVYDWARQQLTQARAVMIRGNPFDTSLGTLRLHATKYYDVAFSWQRPGFVLADPFPGGWTHSPKDETRTTKARVKKAGTGVLLAVALGAGVLFWMLSGGAS